VLAFVAAGIAGAVTVAVQFDVEGLPSHWHLAARQYPVRFED